MFDNVNLSNQWSHCLASNQQSRKKSWDFWVAFLPLPFWALHHFISLFCYPIYNVWNVHLPYHLSRIHVKTSPPCHVSFFQSGFPFNSTDQSVHLSFKFPKITFDFCLDDLLLLSNSINDLPTNQQTVDFQSCLANSVILFSCSKQKYWHKIS